MTLICLHNYETSLYLVMRFTRNIFFTSKLHFLLNVPLRYRHWEKGFQMYLLDMIQIPVHLWAAPSTSWLKSCFAFPRAAFDALTSYSKTVEKSMKLRHSACIHIGFPCLQAALPYWVTASYSQRQNIDCLCWYWSAVHPWFQLLWSTRKGFSFAHKKI